MNARNLCLCALLIALAPSTLYADEGRFAVVVGSNYGQADESPLLYAERDAERVADVLVRLGSVPEENLLLIRGRNAARLEDMLQTVGRRIRQFEARTRRQALLIVYYSGHASVGALHLASSRLPFAKLRAAVRAAGAQVAVLIVDACRSGGITRVKGAVPATPFQIEVEDHLQSSGTAIITSSSAGEDAQESERLSGGIFTHHLVTGLRGAADTSGDRRVTIGEAYRYAYGQTLRTTSRTRFVQHPTYAFQIKGKREITLTRTDRSIGHGQLRLVDAGSYVIMRQGRNGAVVAELRAEAGTDVLLPRGDYLLRKRSARTVREASVAISPRKRTSVRASSMTSLPYGRTVRRGLRERSAVGLDAMAIASRPVLSGQSPSLFGGLAATLETQQARLQLRFRYGLAEAANSDVSMSQNIAGIDLGALRIFDISALNIGAGLGLRMGGDWIMQRFDTKGIAPNRDQWVWRLSPVFRVEHAPSARWTIGVECGVDVYAMQVQRGEATAWDNPVAPFCAMGWSMYLP